MTQQEYDRKYAYLGDKKEIFNTSTYKQEQRYWDRMSVVDVEIEENETEVSFSFITLLKLSFGLGLLAQLFERLGG